MKLNVFKLKKIFLIIEQNDLTHFVTYSQVVIWYLINDYF